MNKRLVQAAFITKKFIKPLKLWEISHILKKVKISKNVFEKKNHKYHKSEAFQKKLLSTELISSSHKRCPGYWTHLKMVMSMSGLYLFFLFHHELNNKTAKVPKAELSTKSFGVLKRANCPTGVVSYYLNTCMCFPTSRLNQYFNK